MKNVSQFLTNNQNINKINPNTGMETYEAKHYEANPLIEYILEHQNEIESSELKEAFATLNECASKVDMEPNCLFFSEDFIRFIFTIFENQNVPSDLLNSIALLIVCVSEQEYGQKFFSNSEIFILIKLLFQFGVDTGLPDKSLILLSIFLQYENISNSFFSEDPTNLLIESLDYYFNGDDFVIRKLMNSLITKANTPPEIMKAIFYKLIELSKNENNSNIDHIYILLESIIVQYKKVDFLEDFDFFTFFSELLQTDFTRTDLYEKTISVNNRKLHLVIYAMGKKVFEKLSYADYINILLNPNVDLLGHIPYLDTLWREIIEPDEEEITSQKANILFVETRILDLIDFLVQNGQFSHRKYAIQFLGTIMTAMSLEQVISYVKEEYIDLAIDMCEPSEGHFLALFALSILYTKIVAEQKIGSTETVEKIAYESFYNTLLEWPRPEGKEDDIYAHRFLELVNTILQTVNNNN